MLRTTEESALSDLFPKLKRQKIDFSKKRFEQRK